MRTLPLLVSSLLLATACGGSTPSPQPPPEPVTEPATSEPATPEPGAPDEPAVTEPATPATPPTPPAPQPAVTVNDAGLATPESVLYDDQADVYLVSNINGSPSEADKNGFISRISPEGQVAELKWIDGSKKATALNAPKGMAFAGDLLYVADIDVVRLFDRKTGKAKGVVKLPGATFLNDISAGPDGKVYVTDTGIKFTADGPAPTKTDAVWVIEKKKAKAIAKGAELGFPNGVLATDQGIWVVTFGTGELYTVDAKGQRSSIQKLPKGQLDGVVSAGDSVLISSWEAGGVFRGTPGGEFTLAFPNLTNPADIGYDSKRNRVLVPLFTENGVVAFDVK